MTTTKNTTATERRIARREALANSLKTLAVTIEKLGAEAGFVREAATELLIGNTEAVLAQPWATDPPRPTVEQHNAVTAALLKRSAEDCERFEREMAMDIIENMRRDPVETGRTTVTVGAMNIPGRREPGIALQAGPDGRLGPEPQRVHLGPLTVTITGPQGAGKSRLAAMIRSKLFFYDDVTIVELTGEGPAVPLPPGVRFEPQAVVVQFGRRKVVVRRAAQGDDHIIELFRVPSGCEGAPTGCLIGIPDEQHPIATLTFPTEQHADRVFNAMLPDDQVVNEAMVERAVDAWEQWWNGYTGRDADLGRREAMRHALQQALEVRS